jgi:uncharacterized protein YndB with AHSA1/START domain
MAHPFELINEIEVDATPEEVWEAIATGLGTDAWFMGKNEIEPREGGIARTELPGFGFEATVTAWEPPTRFATKSPESEDGSLHAFEYIVEGRDKGSTVVRWVHSGFLGDNWESEYEGLSEGDPMYFDKLAKYLTYFRGRIATPVNVFGGPVKDREHAWDVFRVGLGLSGAPAMEEGVRLTPQGLPAMEGVVDYLSPSFLGVRTDDGLYRFMHTFDTSVGLGHHIFVEGLDQAQTEEAWRSWLTKLFA